MSVNVTTESDPVTPVPRSGLWPALGFGLLAAGLTFAFLQTLTPVFHVDEKYNIEGLGESGEKWTAYLNAKRYVDIQNSAVAVGLLGTFLGIALGVSWPGSTGPLKRIILGACIGFLAGVVAGAAGCALQYKFAASGQATLMQVVLVQMLMFAILGTALGGLWGSFAKSTRAIIERAGAGLAAGIVAAVAYPVICSLLFASTNIDNAIPHTLAVQIVWLTCAWLAFGYLIPGAGSR